MINLLALILLVLLSASAEACTVARVRTDSGVWYMNDCGRCTVSRGPYGSSVECPKARRPRR